MAEPRRIGSLAAFQKLLGMGDEDFARVSKDLAKMIAPHIGDAIRQLERSPLLAETEHENSLRVLVGAGADINAVVEGGVEREVWHRQGQSRFSIIEFANATGHVKNARDRNWAVIRSTGGLDCMADAIVSTCWAQVVEDGLGFEGESFVTATGCPVKFFSTVALATSTMLTDFGAGNPHVIYICPGEYEESVLVGFNQTVDFIGSSWSSVRIGGKSGASVAPTFYGTSGSRYINSAWVKWRSLTVISNDASSGTASAGIAAGSGSSCFIDDCAFEGAVGPSSAAEWAIEEGGSPAYWHIRNSWFAYSYGAFIGAVSGPQRLIENCVFGHKNAINANMTTALRIGGNTAVVGCQFNTNTGTTAVEIGTGINNDSTGILISSCMFNGYDRNIYISSADGVGTLSLIGNKVLSGESFLDASSITSSGGLAGAQNSYLVARGNHGALDSGATAFKFPTNVESVRNWVIKDNYLWGESLTAYSGARPLGMKMSENYFSRTPTSTPDGMAPLDGGITQEFTFDLYWFFMDNATSGNVGIGFVPFRYQVGDTEGVTVETSFVLTNVGSTTHYFEVDAAGTVSRNTTGFTTGSRPLLEVSTTHDGVRTRLAGHVNRGAIVYWATAASIGAAPTAHDHTTADGTGPATNDEHDGYGEYAEIAAPSTPAANKVRIYPKSDGLMYAKDDAGVEREMGTVAHVAAADPHTGYVLESLLDAKGDLIAASADNTPGRLAVGADGTMLQAYSAGAVGLRYQVAANAAIIANVSLSAESAGTDDTWARGDHVHLLTAYSRKQYVFVPDAAPATTITAGDAQGPILHSGPNNETADALEVDAETAPGASGLPITVQYGDTNDLDAVASWTTIATLTLSSEKSSRTTSMTNATVTAARLLRMNVGTIVGTPKDCTVTLHTKAPLVA